MNKRILIALLATFSARSAFAVHGEGNVSGHTFFSVQRPPYASASPEKVSNFRLYRTCLKEDGIRGALEVVFFGSRTVRPGDIAEFFLPFGKRTLGVLEYKPGVSTGDNIPGKDIEARNFNIKTDPGSSTTFGSTLRFCPRQTLFGIGFTYKQAITTKHHCDDEGLTGFWGEVSFPVVHVTNTMGMIETVTSTGGGVLAATGLNGVPFVPNMTDAFKQDSWKYGKICGKMSKWGVADIELKIGYNTIEMEKCHLNSYAGVVVPTGNKPQGHLMFEPIVGNNHHFGLMLGNNLGFELIHHGDHKVEMEWDTNSRFLFYNYQVRSYDLIDKAWSRYLSVYSNKTAAQAAATAQDANSGTAGINIFTGCFKVSPRFSFNLNNAYLYTHSCGFSAEVGYNFYSRQAEELKLKDTKFNSAAIESVVGEGFTNPYRTIRNNLVPVDVAVADYQAIQLSDINIDSASHPAVLSNILYATVAYDRVWYCFPVFVSVGGSYEFSSVNTALHRWMAWGKFGFSF